jgi:hypothetical protein
MNYHEMTMGEPRDSPARRKQFLIICTVMASVFLYATITAGAWNTIEISNGNFPGGEFVYKSTKRDYAAAPSLERQIAKDLGLTGNKKDTSNDAADLVYTIYLDHPGQIRNGRYQRFASGYLAKTGDPQMEETAQRLLKMNKNIQPPTRKEVQDLPASDLWKRLKYKRTTLPKTKAAVVHFPFTNGFVSAMVFSLKVLPALRKHAQEQQKQSALPKVTVVSTCSIADQMCTHYSPLDLDAEAFLLGQPTSEEYEKSVPADTFVDWKAITDLKTFRRIWGKKEETYQTSSDQSLSDEL